MNYGNFKKFLAEIRNQYNIRDSSLLEFSFIAINYLVIYFSLNGTTLIFLKNTQGPRTSEL